MCKTCVKHNAFVKCPGCGKVHRVKHRRIRGLLAALSRASAEDTHKVFVGARKFHHKVGH